MFDQTFVSPRAPGKPLAMLASVAGEVGVLAVATVLSILYTVQLPQAQLKTMLILPRAPLAAHERAETKPGPSVTGASPRRLLLDLRPLPVHAAPVQSNLAVAAPDLGQNITSGQDAAGVLDSIGTAASPPLNPPHRVAPKQVDRIRVGGAVQAANLLNRVLPQYPVLARQMRIQGTVQFTAVIAKDGTVKNLQFVHGPALLVAAAASAVMQWRYRPTLLNGEPVEVATQIDVTFTLSPDPH